jgi:hypothetical protein
MRVVESVARFLLKLVGWFGRPKGIRTDGGSQYDSHLIDVFCHLLGFDRHVTTLAYRPQAKGKVERVNKEVGRHLRFITKGDNQQSYEEVCPSCAGSQAWTNRDASEETRDDDSQDAGIKKVCRHLPPMDELIRVLRQLA